MEISLRAYTENDTEAMRGIWNKVIEAGTAFPQENILENEEAKKFFAQQSYCGVAECMQTREILGLYILHPNNVGRCGHICNASYAVREDVRGRGIGEKLVRDCMRQAKRVGFRVLQFNAVVKTNYGARRLYEKIGFVPLGTIPGGFRMPDGAYADIIPYYAVL